MDENGIIRVLLNILTGNLLNDFIDWAQRKTSDLKLIREIKEKLERDHVHNETKSVLSRAISKAKDTVYSCKAILKGFLQDKTNRQIIISWIIEDISDLTSIVEDEFNYSPYCQNDEEKDLVLVFLSNLFNSIKLEKNSVFTPETLTILSSIHSSFLRIEKKLDGIGDTTGLIESKVSTTEKTVKEIQYKTDLLPLIAQKLDIKTDISTSEVIPDSMIKKELQEIKQLLDTGKIKTARNKLLKLEAEIVTDANIDNETKFVLYAYIANTYLLTIEENKKAYEYLLKSAKVCSDDFKIHRNIALAFLLQNKAEEGIKEIDQALVIKPTDAEALQIKSNLLILSEKYDEALNLFQDREIEDAPHKLYSKSYIYFKNGGYSKALEYTKRAIEKDDKFMMAHLLFADVIISQFEPSITETGIIKEEFIEQMRNALIHLKSAEKLVSDEQTDLLVDIIEKQGMLNSWLGNDIEARNNFYRAKQLMPQKPELIWNYAFSLIVIGEYQEAIDNLEELKKYRPNDSNIILTIAELHIMNGNPSMAIGILNECISKQTPDTVDLRFHAVLINALDRNFKTTDAEALLEKWEKQYGESVELLIAKSQHYHRLGNFAKTAEILDGILPVVKGKQKLKVGVLLADVLSEESGAQDFKKAADLFGSVCNRHIVDHSLKGYANALFHSKQYVKCLELCNNVEQIHGFTEYFSELKAIIYYNSKNFLFAANCFRYLAGKRPNKVGFLRNYAYCLFRAGKHQEAFEVLQQVENKVGDSADELAFLSTAYSFVGKMEKALDLAWRAINKDFNDPKKHLYYFSLFLRVENFIPDIQEKYAETFRDVSDKFNERFPDEPGLLKIQISEQPDELRKQLHELLKPISQTGQNFERVYYEYKMPVSFLASGAGRSLITTWSALTEHCTLKIWASSGMKTDLEEELKTIQNSTSIIIDPIAMFTIRLLEIFDKIQEAFNEIFITQAVIDELQEQRALQELSLKEGFTIFEKNGELGRIDIPKQVIENNIKSLSELISVLTENNKIKVIGKSLIRLEESDGETIQKIADALGKETSETLAEAKSRSIAMYAEDFRLRQLGKIEFGIKSFGTRALLDNMLLKNLISIDKFQECLISLVVYNYYFVSINSGTLTYATLSENFLRTRRNMAVFEALKYSGEKPVKIALEYIKWLWHETDNSIIRRDWTLLLLDCISYKEDRKNILKYLKNNLNSIFRPLEIEAIRKFKTLLKEWEISQLVV